MAGSPGLTGLSLRARSCAEVGGQLEEVCASSENADSAKAIARPAGRGSAWRMLLMAGSVCWGGGKPWLECRPEAWRAREDYSPTFCAFARSTISQNRENAIDRRGGALRALRGSGG